MQFRAVSVTQSVIFAYVSQKENAMVFCNFSEVKPLNAGTSIIFHNIYMYLKIKDSL